MHPNPDDIEVGEPFNGRGDAPVGIPCINRTEIRHKIDEIIDAVSVNIFCFTVARAKSVSLPSLTARVKSAVI
jgi:hypothetical protein